MGLLVGIPEVLGHDADDGPTDAVEADLLADDIGASCKALLPQPVAQDDDLRRCVDGRPLVVLGEDATEQRLHAERGKRVSADRLTADAFCRSRAGVCAEVGIVSHRGADQIEGSILVAPGKVVGDARMRLLRRVVERVGADHDDAIVPRDRQTTAQHRIEHAEDSGVGADAQRKRGECDDGERGIAPQHAGAIDDVLTQVVQPGDRARVTALFREQWKVADGATRGELRLAFGHAAFDVLLRQQLDVERQLAGELLVHGVASKQRAPSLTGDAQEPDDHLRALQQQADCRREPIP